ncbi:hypothetical protein [Microvirga guangxiensis]|uniref:Uncharacterized protein n=1 Tax=Microvirga guangxiensis TaxID=549386 RepID=A0A1G5EWR2_9HYPH|nr:hypothetical protein [Microvirga guangxiensis]SCY31423.1 hypothetical protein SAMN02927923_01132 [Microvirga guangxiensis]
MTEAKRKIGLPWYSRNDYAEIRNMMADRHNLAPSYEQWLAAAENNESVGIQAGLEIERILIEPSSFSRWCATNGLEPDSVARMRYVAESQAKTAKV